MMPTTFQKKKFRTFFFQKKLLSDIGGMMGNGCLAEGLHMVHVYQTQGDGTLWISPRNIPGITSRRISLLYVIGLVRKYRCGGFWRSFYRILMRFFHVISMSTFQDFSKNISEISLGRVVGFCLPISYNMVGSFLLDSWKRSIWYCSRGFFFNSPKCFVWKFLQLCLQIFPQDFPTSFFWSSFRHTIFETSKSFF